MTNKTTLTLSKDLRDTIMFIKIQCKAKDAETVVRDAIHLLKAKLKEEPEVEEHSPQVLNSQEKEDEKENYQ